MKKIFFFLLLLFITASTIAQTDSDDAQQNTADTAWKHIYRGSYPRINDLVHTKLSVKFDYDKQWMYGEEWVTLQPHFYTTDSLTLDAKGMDIKEIAILKGNKKIPLKFSYDSSQLKITLDKPYIRDEKYTVYLNYISRPNEVKEHGSAAISDAKGLYFIDRKSVV